MATVVELASQVEERLLERNALFEHFFSREAPRLAEACREMSERFLRGGRLLAFGRGPYATDAQHVSVEFVHPVIVGKRALPALDLSILFRPWLEAILHPEDMVMGFGPPEGDPEVWATLQLAHLRDAMTFALPGMEGSYALDAPTQDPFMHQEMVEVLYHTLWERCTSSLSIVNWAMKWETRRFSIHSLARRNREPPTCLLKSPPPF
jgi:D-sedoheptulose 7-phosphate isomerase